MDGPNSTIATFDHSLNILHIRERSELDHPDDPWVHVSRFHLGSKRIEAIATLIIDGALRIVMCVRRRRDRFELRVVAPGDTSGYILLQPSPIQPPFQILPSPSTELSGKAFLPLLAVASPGQLLVFSPRDEWSCICRMNLVRSGGVESTLPLPRIAWSPFVKSKDKIEGGIEIASTEETPANRILGSLRSLEAGLERFLRSIDATSFGSQPDWRERRRRIFGLKHEVNGLTTRHEIHGYSLNGPG